MDPIAIMIGLVFLGGAMVFVFRPLRARPRLAFKNATAALCPREAHAVAIKALRDLDFDYRTGKVSEEDYSGLRSRLMAEAAKIYYPEPGVIAEPYRNIKLLSDPAAKHLHRQRRK